MGVTSAAAKLLALAIGIAAAHWPPAAAQGSVAESYTSDGDVSVNSPQSSLELQAAAGNAQAQFALGSLYARGDGALDEELAERWWRKAAEQGLAEAQNELAAALAAGRGVQVDQKQAFAWYQKAAEQGLAVAQTNLGLMYLSGVVTRPDPVEAVVWFRKAAEQNLGWAQVFLGDAYASGRGLQQNYRLAHEWYLKAALQDYVGAQTALGTLYARGQGVKTDKAEAVRWFALAARQADDGAQRSLENILGPLRRVRLPAAVAVREQPDLASTVIRTAAAGETAHVLKREEKWTQVYLADGHIVGFISAE
jgi:TPR repeat protein